MSRREDKNNNIDDVCSDKMTIETMKLEDETNKVLPTKRIWKIMKLDDDVEKIARETPMLLAKATEIFITEITKKAWQHALQTDEDNNNQKLLKQEDIVKAIQEYELFDFLKVIMPPTEKKKATELSQHYEQFSEPNSIATQQAQQCIATTQLQGQNEPITLQILPNNWSANILTPVTAQVVKGVHILEQVMTKNNGMVYVPRYIPQIHLIPLDLFHMQNQHQISQIISIGVIPVQIQQILQVKQDITPALMGVFGATPSSSTDIITDTHTPTTSTSVITEIPTIIKEDFQFSVQAFTPASNDVLCDTPTSSKGIITDTPEASTSVIIDAPAKNKEEFSVQEFTPASISVLGDTPSSTDIITDIPTSSTNLLTDTPTINEENFQFSVRDLTSASKDVLGDTPSSSKDMFTDTPTASTSVITDPTIKKMDFPFSAQESTSMGVLGDTPSSTVFITASPTASTNLLTDTPTINEDIFQCSVRELTQSSTDLITDTPSAPMSVLIDTPTINEEDFQSLVQEFTPASNDELGDDTLALSRDMTTDTPTASTSVLTDTPTINYMEDFEFLFQ